MFNRAIRQLTYTTHVTSSLGWVGAVIVFIALALIGLTSPDEITTRGAYLVMAPAAWFALVPLAHVSLLSGLALCLGTAWGAFRYYWVVSKLVITVFATGVLLAYMATFREMAGIAADAQADLAVVRNPSPLVHGVLALVLLLAATWLGVYKPFGTTPYGKRARTASVLPLPSAPSVAGTLTGRRLPTSMVIGMGVLALIAALLLAHALGSGGRP
jgi:hypothetical protein